MQRVKRVIQVLRNNWKKSVFGAVVLTYGVHTAKGKYDCNILMKAYCHEALRYGNLIETDGGLRTITVVLNPAANKRKAKKNFDKYCAPLLNLAGIRVNILSTKAEGEACILAEGLDETVDAVVVAGGNGTLAETVTGLLRRSDGDNPLSKRIPIGILPLGRTNTVAESLFNSNNIDHVALMAEATMAVIKGYTKPLDVMKIEQLEKERDQRPVYSVSGLEWGALYDAFAKRDKYWYWGALRSYAAYIFMGLKDEAKGMTWSCNADIMYSLPCAGCSQCYLDHETVKLKKTHSRWWQVFTPRQTLGTKDNAPKINYSKIVNSACRVEHEIQISSVDFALKPGSYRTEDDVPHINVFIGPPSVGYWDFVSKGWDFIKKSELEPVSKIQVKGLKLCPVSHSKAEDPQHWFYIDNDDYEVKPIYIKLLPKKILIFCKQENF